MPRVKLIVSRSGAKGAFAPGDEIEVGDAEAKRMIEAGQAVPVRAAKATKETATKTTKRERATK